MMYRSDEIFNFEIVVYIMIDVFVLFCLVYIEFIINFVREIEVKKKVEGCGIE